MNILDLMHNSKANKKQFKLDEQFKFRLDEQLKFRLDEQLKFRSDQISIWAAFCGHKI